MHLVDSRRLTGPSLWLDRPGAVLEVRAEGAPAEDAAAAWTRHAQALLRAVGWAGETTTVRLHPGGAVLALTAPIDGLYAALALAEAAWEAARADGEGIDEATAARLRAQIADERDPALRALQDAAAAHGVRFLWDEDFVTVGSGTGSRSWPPGALPDPAEVDWRAVHDVPVVLVTGTNGKSTTVRLLARILAAEGRAAGLTSSDFVRAAGEIIDRGDCSGPGSARLLLRDRRVEAAVLEVARGGLLRRGLAVERAAVALVTNVAEDHLGPYGIRTLADLTEAKLTVAKAVPGGPLVLNADDASLVARAPAFGGQIGWFSLEAANPTLKAHRQRGGVAAFVEEDSVIVAEGDRKERLLAVEAMPFALGGAARHNIANALAAACAAGFLGVPAAAIAEGLRTFRNDPIENPGRTNVFTVGGITVVVDFAHNPHGLDALVETVRRMPARRRLVTLGQAGDRSDDDVRGLVRAACRIAPDHAVVMELPGYERGRAPGEVAGLVEDELRRHGLAGDTAVTRVATSLDAVEAALRWAAPGDLLLLLVYGYRDAVFARLAEAGAEVVA